MEITRNNRGRWRSIVSRLGGFPQLQEALEALGISTAAQTVTRVSEFLEANNPRTQPAQDALSFSCSNKHVVGDRVHCTVSWNPDSVHSMSSGNLKNRIKSYIWEEASSKQPSDLGHVADIEIDMDMEAGVAEVNWKSSEDSAPQLAPAHSA